MTAQWSIRSRNHLESMAINLPVNMALYRLRRELIWLTDFKGMARENCLSREMTGSVLDSCDIS